MSNIKPTALKKLEGTFRKDRAPKNELTPTIALTLDAPSELNEWGVKLWGAITEEYCKVGLITNVDVGSLFALCNEFGTYCESDDIIKAKGLEIEEDVYSAKGELVGTKTIPNPMLKVRNDAFKNYNSMCSKFGITPADRARLSAPNNTSNDKFEEFD